MKADQAGRCERSRSCRASSIQQSSATPAKANEHAEHGQDDDDGQGEILAEEPGGGQAGRGANHKTAKIGEGEIEDPSSDNTPVFGDERIFPGQV